MDSQIGAWSSQQSQPIDSREALTHQEKEMREKLTREYLSKNESIPRPPHWGGYRLNPTRIEFWKVWCTLDLRLITLSDREEKEGCMTGLSM